MQERILVPLDGSEVGEAVLPKVEDLVLRAAPRMDAEVTLLRVISKMNYNMLTDDEAAQLPYNDQELKQLTQQAQEYLDKVAQGLRSKGIRVKTLIVTGNIAKEIVKAARESKAHLIAMSTHDRSGIVRWAIGSVTDKVMRLEGEIPVMAVKPSGKKEKRPSPAMDSLQGLLKQP
jgi:nucleotide-binding universal stress UspA family protein